MSSSSFSPHDVTRAPQSLRGCSGDDEWDPVYIELAIYPRKENPGEREAGRKSTGKMPWIEMNQTLLDTAWARQEKGPGRKKYYTKILSSN